MSETAWSSTDLQSREWTELAPHEESDLVTAHRRESFGERFEQIFRPARLADRGDVQLIYPVHPNPNVQERCTAI
jgi:UDP-N-acetylglucosamine 2-epimerase